MLTLLKNVLIAAPIDYSDTIGNVKSVTVAIV